MRKAPRGEEISSRVTAVLSAGALGYAPDPVSNSSAKHSLPRNDSRKPVDSFCSAGKGGSQTGIGLASGVLWPGAALEQSRKDRPDRHGRGIAGER